MKPTTKRFFRSFFSLYYLYKLGACLREFEPNVVFAHSVCGIISPSFLLAAWWYDIPVVYQVPNLSCLPEPPSPRTPRALVVWSKRHCHRLLLSKIPHEYVAPSRTAAEYLQNSLMTSGVHIVPHPTFHDPPPALTVDQKPPLGLTYVGRLSKEKGLETVIEAVAAVSRDHDIKLDIYGDGESEARLKQKVLKLGVEERITFRGWINHDDLPDVYRAADVTILNSQVNESFGLSIIESMSQGTPVITTDMGGQNELIEDGETGFIIQPKEPEEIQRILERLGEGDAELQRLSRNALDASREYSPSNHVDRVISIFRMVT